jgi:hypothetical protein
MREGGSRGAQSEGSVGAEAGSEGRVDKRLAVSEGCRALRAGAHSEGRVGAEAKSEGRVGKRLGGRERGAGA